MSPRRRAITRTATAVIILFLIVVAGIGYAALSAATAKTGSGAKNTLVVEEESQPDTLDPAVTYVTPGWEVVDQVYQGLVTYNGSSITQFVGVLAKNWTVSADMMNYTFILRSGVTFSNGDPFNAYVMW